ncbi:hypothetical protein Tco_1466223 [Tanacetum coccineum]
MCMQSNTRCQKQKKDAWSKVCLTSLHSNTFKFFLKRAPSKAIRIEHGFKWPFHDTLGQDADYFSQSNGNKYFVEYTGIKVKTLQRYTTLTHGKCQEAVANEHVIKDQYDRRVNKMTDAETARESGNDTNVDVADIRPIYDEEPMTEVRVDQYPEQYQVKSPMLDLSPDNQTTEYSKQSLESENILLKKTVAQFQKDFSRMEAHYITLELKYQNQALKSGQHGQILNETSNKANIKMEIDVLETMNTELEHIVAKLRKENETLKKHHKYLYDSIKITRSTTIEKTTSLLANNADLNASESGKFFAIAALKNNLRKLKGNNRRY